VKGDGGDQDQAEELGQRLGMEDRRRSGHQWADDRKRRFPPRVGSWPRPGSCRRLTPAVVEGVTKIALVDAAGLVVDIYIPPPIITEIYMARANGGGEQKLHVVDVGIKLDNFQGDLTGQAGWMTGR